MPNPNSLDWLKYQDIQISDFGLRQQFQQYMQSGQYAQALAVLTNNAERLKGKAYIADTINIVINGIINLEQRYNIEVTEYLANLINEFDSLVNNLKNLGLWQSNTQYIPYNFVVYNNLIYMCITKPPIGTLPTNTSYWLYLGLQGTKGDPGVNVNMTYTWNSSYPYQANDLVIYDGDIYCAKIANTNVVPTESNTWTLFLNISEGKINIGVTPPSNPVRDMIWFETISNPNMSVNSDPIFGTFKRYNITISDWEDMYPNVLFHWIEGADLFSRIKTEDKIVIKASDWENNQWIYDNPKIIENSIIKVWGDNLTQEQYVLYDSLSIVVEEGNLMLNTQLTPTIDLPIIITIQ